MDDEISGAFVLTVLGIGLATFLIPADPTLPVRSLNSQELAIQVDNQAEVQRRRAAAELEAMADEARRERELSRQERVSSAAAVRREQESLRIRMELEADIARRRAAQEFAASRARAVFEERNRQIAENRRQQEDERRRRQEYEDSLREHERRMAQINRGRR